MKIASRTLPRESVGAIIPAGRSAIHPNLDQLLFDQDSPVVKGLPITTEDIPCVLLTLLISVTKDDELVSL